MHLSHIQIREVINFVLQTDLILDSSVVSGFQDLIVLFGLILDKLDETHTLNYICNYQGTWIIENRRTQ